MRQSKKKILYLITKSNWGGAQRYVYDLAANLPRDRFDIAVAAGGRGPLFYKLQEKNVRTISFAWLERDVGFFKELRACAEIFRLLKKEKPDIIHLNSPKAGALGGIGIFFFKLLTTNCQLPTISTVHGWPFREDRSLWQRAMIFLGSWLSSFFWNKVIVINAADFQSAKRFIPRRKLVFIPNGIGAIDFLPRAQTRAFFAERIGKPISNDTILIGTVAELTRNKGLTFLLDAIQRLKLRTPNSELRTLIIGGGEQKNELEQKIRDCGLIHIVFLLGSIPDASRYLKALDIFVLPSIKEGLPYAVLEAMQARLSIAATAIGGIPDMIEHEKQGLTVPPKNPAQLASALMRLLEDAALRSRLGQAAANRQETNFFLHAMIEKTIAVYEHS